MALPESQEAARVMLQTMLSEHMTSGHKLVQTYYMYKASMESITNM